MNETQALLIISSSAESSLVCVGLEISNAINKLTYGHLSPSFLICKRERRKIFIGTHHARAYNSSAS